VPLFGRILGLPPATRQPELVAYSTIGHNALPAGVSRQFRPKRPSTLLRSFVEEVLEGSLQAQLVHYELLPLQVLNILEIGLDYRVVNGQF
jgi:hypothetical protein